MLHGYANQTILPMFVKTQHTSTSTLHVTAKYVPETKLPTKLGFYATYTSYLMTIYIGDPCAPLYTTYEVTGTKHVSRNTIYNNKE